MARPVLLPTPPVGWCPGPGPPRVGVHRPLTGSGWSPGVPRGAVPAGFFRAGWCCHTGAGGGMWDTSGDPRARFGRTLCSAGGGGWGSGVRVGLCRPGSPLLGGGMPRSLCSGSVVFVAWVAGKWVERSSPHARGAGGRGCGNPCHSRAIPACAGSNSCTLWHLGPSPRARGLYCLPSVGAVPTGPSPRAWGNRIFVSSSRINLGAIPTYVGSNEATIAHVHGPW